MGSVTLLGPQRLSPFIGAALATHNITGPVAAITAGWQERESEDDELRAEVRCPVINLRLYERWDDIRRHDQDFFLAHRRRQDWLRQLRAVYTLRLTFLMDQTLELLHSTRPHDLVAPEIAHAIQMLRSLDQHYLDRVRAVNEEFNWDWNPQERPTIRHHREEVLASLRSAQAVLIAGGHIAVLLNRLRLFDLAPVISRMPVFAWSAGAMLVTDRIVLFHDHPPQGKGHAEVFEEGLGLVPGIIVLPNARHRLDLGDPSRIRLMASRLAPALCVPMDENESFYWDAGALRCGPDMRCLRPDGTITSLQEC